MLPALMPKVTCVVIIITYSHFYSQSRMYQYNPCYAETAKMPAVAIESLSWCVKIVDINDYD